MNGRIAQGFARRLGSYDAAAIAQTQIAARLAKWVAPLVSPGSRILELGHGTGLFTHHIARLAPDEVWLNDLIAPLPMIRWPAASRIHAAGGDAAGLGFPDRLDLIASASMLQWLDNPRALLGKAATALRADGILAVTSFGPDNFPELGAAGLTDGAPSYRDAAGLCRDLPDSMTVIAAWDEDIPVIFPNAQALFAHLRATGVNGLMAGQLSVPRLRALMAQMNRQGTITLTYRPSYCIAAKSCALSRHSPLKGGLSCPSRPRLS